MAERLQKPPSPQFWDNGEDPNFDRKLDAITAAAPPHLKEHLLTRISRENCQTIVNYVLAMQTEIGPSESYRIGTIHALKYFAEFHKPKTFQELQRQDVVDFLDSLRKPESVDHLHKWIGTYEFYRIKLIRFFKWLYAPDIPQSQRKKPAVMENIPKLKRKEISIYKSTDLWTEEDDFIFHKYCPSSRDRCWHAMARDTGCRPHEMLKLKVKDIIAQQLEGGYQIARINVNGKTGTRNTRLNNSYPRLKDWLTNGHPFPGNPNAYLFCGYGNKSKGRRIGPRTINAVYNRYRKLTFPRLLDDPLVPEDDKRKIRDLLKKPWNPYIRRHTAATEISKQLKDSVLIDQYMGWSHSGNTRQKYQHYYADDSFDAMLVVDGIVTSKESSKGKMRDLLRPKMCPNCQESNKPESKFCAKCKFVLSYDGYNEVTSEAEQQKKQMQTMAQELEKMKVELARVGKEADGWALQTLEHWTQAAAEEREREKRVGRSPPLRPIDTESGISFGEMPPELLKLMSLPWSEIVKPENRRKVYGLFRRKLG